MFKVLAAIAVFASPFANSAGVESMTLQEVYALPMPAVEAIVLSTEQAACDGLVSVYKQGKNDPAQLSPAQFCAVQNYSNARFLINKPLWTATADQNKLSGTDWAYIRVMDEALKKIKSEAPTVVYRGTARKDLVFTKPGQTVRLKGYTSTSLDREKAEEFIKDRLMIISVISGKNIKNYSNAGLEDEYLLARSTFVRFERSEVKKLELFTDNGPEERLVEIVYLTEIPRPK